MQRPSLLKNIVLNGGGRGVLLLLSLAATPVLLHRLGNEAYGVYILALTLGGLLGLLDLGLTPALVSLLSRAWQLGEHERVQRIVGTAITLFLGIGISIGAALAMLVPWMVDDLLGVPPPLRDDARFALWLSVGAFTLNMWLSVYNAVPVALERYDLIAARTVLLALATTTATIIYALLGGGLRGLLGINLLGSLAGLAVFYWVSRALLPQTRFRPGFDTASFRGLARFGAFKFAGNLGNILTFQFDRFAVGAMLGVQAVSFYAIPANGTARVFSLLTELAAPLFPRVSKLKGEREAIRALYLRGSRVMVLLSFVVLSTLFVFADFVLAYWIGGERGWIVARESAPTMRWLLAALMVQSVAAIPYIFCEALGKPEVNNSFSVISALIHVPLVLMLVPSLGIAGAAVALFLNSITQTVVFILFAGHRIMGVSAVELFVKALMRPAIAAGVASAVGFFARQFVGDVVSLLFSLVLMAVTYAVTAVVTSAVTREDFSFAGRLVEWLPMWFPGRRVAKSMLEREQELKIR